MLIYTLPVILSLAVLVVLKIYVLIIHKNCRSKVCLFGKTALVTGGNSGIGYQIVLDLVQRGCRVIIADVTEDENLLENVFKETQSRNVIFKYVDLSSLDSVRELANFVMRTEGKLDILINNAGVGNIAEITRDGLDKVMQVNYFSAFLLTHLVIDLLKETKGRIIFTSSVLSYFHNFSLKRLNMDGTNMLDKLFCYNNSKLCIIMMADIFAVKLKRYGVTSNTYHPGVACTNIFLGNIRNRNSIFYDVPSYILNYIILFIGWVCF